MAAGLVSFLFALFWAARFPPWAVGTVRVGRLPVAWWWGGFLLYPVALGVAWAYVRRMTRWEEEEK